MIRTKDDELLAELRVLFDEIDPLDPMLLEQAKLAYSWRTVDADLAELAYDSLADPEVLAAVRGGSVVDAGPRLLGFGVEPAAGSQEALTVEIEVGSERSGLVLIGQLMPPTAGTVLVQQVGRRDQPSAVLQADDLGRFRVESVPAGPVRLLIEAGDRTIATSWVRYLPE
jgi:hypothetical protein